MRSRDTEIIVVPGFGGSGPDHWQSRWQAKLPSARRVEQANWNEPERSNWIARVTAAVRGSERPVVVVAHSLGVTTLVEAAAQGLPPIAGAFLVAPPSDDAIRGIAAIDPSFAPIPRERLSFPALLVASRTDPYLSWEQAATLAEAWGTTVLDAGNAGHINIESGHGPWPEGLMAFAGFLNKL